jgi:hypothetical protein
MGVLLNQLPPAELARLKAELAETLITYFCYPRFYDHRTASLRMRPVDRAKRQEVWHYLNAIDLSTWSRLDLTSPDFQRHVERLFIQFVQRNRNFFGEQGRKRMADIRTLINTSAASVVQGLYAHLTSRDRNSSTFGGPRPVVSWSASGHPEVGWEQMAQATVLLQQQLQEVRGEIKPTPVDGRTPAATGKRPVRPSAPANGIEAPLSSSIATSRPTPNINNRAAVPLSEPRSTAPLSPARTVAPVPPTAVASSPARKLDPVVDPTDVPTVSQPVTVKPGEAARASATVPAQASSPTPPATSIPPSGQGMAVSQRESSTLLVSEEDVAIFEQMRHQLLIWLRVEAVRSGLEPAGQNPSQLLELLRQQETLSETRLQVVSSLLTLSNQVMQNGHATLLDYKQAMMFHLMHTRR